MVSITLDILAHETAREVGGTAINKTQEHPNLKPSTEKVVAGSGVSEHFTGTTSAELIQWSVARSMQADRDLIIKIRKSDPKDYGL